MRCCYPTNAQLPKTRHSTNMRSNRRTPCRRCPWNLYCCFSESVEPFFICVALAKRHKIMHGCCTFCSALRVELQLRRTLKLTITILLQRAAFKFYSNDDNFLSLSVRKFVAKCLASELQISCEIVLKALCLSTGDSN